MKLPRFVVYIALSFVVTAVLLLFAGNGGMLDYRTLRDYSTALQANIEELKSANEDLLQEVDVLGSDPKRIMLQARELGYFQDGERVIRIEGFNAGKNYYTVGKLLKRSPEQSRRDWPFKAVGVGLPLVLFFVSLSVRRAKNK